MINRSFCSKDTMEHTINPSSDPMVQQRKLLCLQNALETQINERNKIVAQFEEMQQKVSENEIFER